MSKVNFTKYQIGAMVSLVIIGVLNPMSVQVLYEYFLLFYLGVFLLASAYLWGFILYMSFKPQPVKLPKGKTKPSKFIET